MKLCINCKHCRIGYMSIASCEHPNNMKTSPVYGSYSSTLPPELLRIDEQRCGPEGKWFEERKEWRNQRTQDRASNTVTEREPAPWNRMLIVGAVAVVIALWRVILGWLS